MSDTVELDPEIDAIATVYAAIRNLDSASQARILQYVANKVGASVAAPKATEPFRPLREQQDETVTHAQEAPAGSEHESDEFEGISPVARKWMTRNSLTADTISKFFSLGVDDIDLVAKAIPGDIKKVKVRNVFLLKGIAAYLSSGVARFAHDAVRETSIHYDAWDVNNFSRHFGDMSAEVSGSKDTGYTLTSRGLVAAAELIKQM